MKNYPAWKKKYGMRISEAIFITIQRNMGPYATKPVFWVSDKARLKPVSSATETSQRTEISPVASLDIIFFNKRITKALIVLRICAGWSTPVLFANLQRQVFSCRAHMINQLSHQILKNLKPHVGIKLKTSTTCHCYQDNPMKGCSSSTHIDINGQ